MSKKNAPLSRKEEEEQKNASENSSPQLMPMKKGSMFAKFDDLAGLKRKAFANMYKKKSTVSQPGDPSEVQADAVAKAVTEGNAEAAQVELQNDITSDEITAKASGVSIETPPGFEEQLEKMQGGGLPLPEDKKEYLEEMLDADLSEVRLHTSSDAAELADAIYAEAFATGKDIVYPGDLNDEELLVHEVTHTLQDGNGLFGKEVKKKEKTGYNEYPVASGDASYWVTMKLDGDGDGYQDIQLLFHFTENKMLEVQFHHLATKPEFWSNIQTFNYTVPFEEMGLVFEKFSFEENKLTNAGYFFNTLRIYDKKDNTKYYLLYFYANKEYKTNGLYYLDFSDQVLTFKTPVKWMENPAQPVSAEVISDEETIAPLLVITAGPYNDKIYFQFNSNGKINFTGDEIKQDDRNRMQSAEMVMYMKEPGRVVGIRNPVPLYLNVAGFALQPTVLWSDEKSTGISLGNHYGQQFLSDNSDYEFEYSTSLMEEDLVIHHYNYPYSKEETDPSQNRGIGIFLTGKALLHNQDFRRFVIENGKLRAGGHFYGKDAYESLQEFRAPEQLDKLSLPASVYDEIGQASGVINSLIGQLVEKSLMWRETYDLYKEFDFSMLLFDSVGSSSELSDVLQRESILKSIGEKGDAFFKSFRLETVNEWSEHTAYAGCGPSFKYKSNEFTGEYGSPGEASDTLFKTFIENDDFPAVRKRHLALKNGYEKYAAKIAERSSDKTINDTGKAITQWQQMREALTRISTKKYLQKIKAIFYADDKLPDFNSGKSLEELVISLPLWAYVDPADNCWYLTSLMNFDKPFISDKVPFYQERDGREEGTAVPPDELFNGLDHEKHLPKGMIYYERDGKTESQRTTGEKTNWWDIAGYIALGLALVAITLTTFGTGTVAVIGTALFYVSAAASIASTIGQMNDDYKHGQLDSKTLFLGIVEILTSLAQIKLMSMGRVINNSANAAKVASLSTSGMKLYMPLKIASVAGETTQVLVMTYDYAQQIRAIVSAPGSDEDKQRALAILFSQAIVTLGISIIDLRGEFKELKNIDSGTMDLEIVDEDGFTFARPKTMTDPAVRLKEPDPNFPGQNMDSRTLVEFLIGKDKIKRFDEALDNNKETATRMFDDFETSQVYHTMHITDGDIPLTEKRLREVGFADWIDNLDKEKVIKKLDKNTKLKKTYLEMDPKVRRTCTFCESPCDILDGITAGQAARLETVLDTMTEFSPEWFKLKRILSKTRHNNTNKANELLEDELVALEQAMLPNGTGLSKYISDKYTDIVKTNVAAKTGLSQTEVNNLSPSAIEGLGNMTDNELGKLNGKTPAEIELAGTTRWTKMNQFTPVIFNGVNYAVPRTDQILFPSGRTPTTPLRSRSGQPVSAGMTHVIQDHFNRPLANNRSVFSITSADLMSILQTPKVLAAPVIEVEPGMYKRVVDTGTIVGNVSLKDGGGTTTWITIFTDVEGNIITTYPVSPAN